MLGLQFVDGIRRADRDNAIDVYISDEYEDVLRDGAWQATFKVKPEPLTAEEKKAWIATQTGVRSVGSDAFFPFGDNVERARKSGVCYIVEPGGSIRDDNVIETADRYGIAMAFTGMRLFHHVIGGAATAPERAPTILLVSCTALALGRMIPTARAPSSSRFRPEG